MPANIAYSKELEKYMFMGVGSAWHGLGQIVTEAQTWEEAMRLAALDWTVAKRQLQLDGRDVPAWGVIREDNQQFLGSVGSDYRCIQNKDVFTFIDALLEAEKGAHFLSAGALGAGERIFALAHVPQDFTIKGTDDLHKTYLCGLTSHDGSMSNKLFLTDVRVVCENTWNQALSADGKSALTVRHTQNAESKLAEAKRLIKGTQVSAKMIQEKLDALAEREMTKSTLLLAIDRIFKKEAQEEQAKEASLSISKHSEKVMLKVLELFEVNDDNAFPQIRGTAYNLFNAFTEYTDHERTVQMTETRKGLALTETAVRQETSLFGIGNRFKSNVLSTLLDVTSENKRRDLTKSYSIPSGAQDVTTVVADEQSTTSDKKKSQVEQSIDEMFSDDIITID
jgi:phage/plasmid-like protein (TIGR03299 family)